MLTTAKIKVCVIGIIASSLVLLPSLDAMKGKGLSYKKVAAEDRKAAFLAAQVLCSLRDCVCSCLPCGDDDYRDYGVTLKNMRAFGSALPCIFPRAKATETSYHDAVVKSRDSLIFKKRLEYLVEKLLLEKKYSERAAVVFDIDETCLIKLKDDGGPEQWMRVDCVWDFYKKMQENNITCIFLTSRLQSHSVSHIYDYTIAQLTFAGFDNGFLICLPENENAKAGVAFWKSLWRDYLTECCGITILATLDDKLENLMGAYVGIGLHVPYIPDDYGLYFDFPSYFDWGKQSFLDDL